MTGTDSSAPRTGRGASELRIDAAELPIGDRVEAVRSAIWQLVVRVEIEQPPAASVDARCRLRTFGPVTQCSVKANARTIRRTPWLARDDMEPAIFVGLQVSGSSLVIQDGREAVLRPGDLALYDTTRPYTLVNDGGISHHYFRVPRHLLAVPQRALDSAVAVRFDREDPLVELVSGYLARLGEQSNLPLTARSAISVPSVELIRALVTTRAGATRLAQDSLNRTLVERALEYARAHLSDPRLTPDRIAASLNVSVRRLYVGMADAEVSLAGWIRSQRLEACRLELARANHHLTVAAIAARWGFVDAAHFSRVFRAEFGVSPREWRRRSAQLAQFAPH